MVDKKKEALVLNKRFSLYFDERKELMRITSFRVEVTFGKITGQGEISQEQKN